MGYPVVITSLNPGDRGFLFKYMKVDGIGAEVGVWRGEFSAAILANVPIKQLHLIDLPFRVGKNSLEEKHHKEVLERFAQEIKDNKVIIHNSFSFSVAGTFSDGFFDWVYIDGNHHYRWVKADLCAFFSKVKIGGYILGDDYLPKVYEGVIKAVDEIREKPDIETVEIFNSQYVLRRK